MRVLVCIEQRFDRTPDGAVWTQVAYDYSFWLRYLEIFDSVRVLARVRDVDQPPADHVRADGDRVSVAAVPYYLGPWQYAKNRRRVQRAVLEALEPNDAVMLRVGSQVANCLFPLLRRTGRPYGVEVVGDPWDVFAPGTISHPLRLFFRWYFWRQLRDQCAHACAASYVTERALQARYPVAKNIHTISASTIKLTADAMRSPEHRCAASASEQPGSGTERGFSGCSNDVVKLLFVGSLAQLYKAPDVLLEACALCAKKGLNFHLTMVGDGKYRSQLEQQAVDLGIDQRVLFKGQVAAGPAIREQLDKADIFVLPSRTEGLPRALIEAMARSLPCIGTNVGGIPELLAKSDLVPAGDAESLARMVLDVARSETRRADMSHRNHQRALDFRDEVLSERRRGFFQIIRSRTAMWAAERRAA